MVRFVGVTSVCPCARVSCVACVSPCTSTCPAPGSRVAAPPRVFYRYYSLLIVPKSKTLLAGPHLTKEYPLSLLARRCAILYPVHMFTVLSVAVLCALALRMGFGLGSWMCLVQPDASPEDRCAQTWRRPAGRAQPD